MKVTNVSIREVIKERLFNLTDADKKVLDLSDLDTSEVTTMKSLFKEVIVNEIKGLDKWDVSNVLDMSAMFKHCRTGSVYDKVLLCDLSNWDMHNVLNTWHMF